MGQRKSGHVTLTDVAKACGFSVSTVSIVLSEAPLSRNVAEKTRQQIRTTARRLGYHPDAFAQSLRRRRSQTIGVLAYDLTDPFCIPVVRGIQAGLQPAGYLPLVMDAQTQRALFDHYLRMILERRAEGVAVIASWVFEEANLLADIEKNHVPVVILGRDLRERRFSSVLIDNQAGGALAMHHLLELGHTKIAVIRGPQEMFDSAPRWEGICRAAAGAGVQLDSGTVFELPSMVDPASGFKGGLEAARQFVAGKRDFTAVLAFDDLTAMGVIRGLTEAGLRVPQDCSVIGFDDVLPASMTTPSITTIRQPLEQMGLAAAHMLLETLTTPEKGAKAEPKIYMGTPELVVRQSTAAPRATSSGSRRG
jgi:LacI family transcriptional regulator